MEFKQKNTKFLFLVFTFIFVVVYTLTADFLQLKSYNILSKLTEKSRIASDNVLLVVIDDKSLHEIGRWPWKREYYLEIFDYFEKYTNVKAMGYDGLVMAPDLEHPQSDKKFFNAISKFDKLTAGVAFSYDKFEKGIDEKYYDELLKTKTTINIIDKRKSKKAKEISAFKSFTALQKQYFENVKALGFVNVPEDKDGYVRKANQLYAYKDFLFPSLGFAVYSKYTGINEYILTDKFIYGYSNKHLLRVPIQINKGFIANYISYYKTDDKVYSHKKYSASDIIKSYRAIKKGEKPILDTSTFNNKVVFIGANANAQALNDIERTPISEKFSGLDIQATNFDNLINNSYFRATNNLYNLLTCVLIFILIFILINTMPIVTALLSSTCIMFGYLFFAIFMYFNKIAVSLILPELFVIVAIACAYSYRYLIEGNKKEKIQKAMGKYLSHEVMQNVVQNIDNIELGGKREDITVLFADIRNFTSISETMDAGSVTMILNEYFSALVPVIEEHGGVLNKFMGDAVLAIFGEPKRSENHALDAVQCGIKMLKKVKHLQDKWIDEGKPKIEIGIGISSGEAFIGNIGSVDRLEYTVIGDTVNTASRIENYNKVYKTNFLISEATYQRVKNKVDVITINNVLIRGKASKMNIYEVIRLVD
ncbi:MAG: adenylate/guanylate cyclase domain-containing protein [Candidatus Gastranaerophilales bacterium]|nr:adenylate/guanylate cyclase domain-containing protein [Candidatus Gastranaerophilales bacterium]